MIQGGGKVRSEEGAKGGTRWRIKGDARKRRLKGGVRSMERGKEARVTIIHESADATTWGKEPAARVISFSRWRCPLDRRCHRCSEHDHDKYAHKSTADPISPGYPASLVNF